MELAQGFHLTYCTNIHPARGYEAVVESLKTHTAALRRRLAPDRPFGVGLRLSAAEAEALLRGDRLARFKAFLDEAGLYVYTINGFPYGNFHGEPVKAQAFAPDWREEARLSYTLRLIAILSALLPPGMDGGISTVPLSFKGWIAPFDRKAVERMVDQLTEAVAVMASLGREKGQTLHLDLEPEPGSLIETVEDAVRFFENWLLPIGAPMLARRLRVSEEQARALFREHLRLCLDACHLAVGYEDPALALERLARAGMKVGKLQISSALKTELPNGQTRRSQLALALAPFAESTYLHQVIERRLDGALRFHPDLQAALPAIRDPGAREWRVHFHVPVFAERLGLFETTQPELRRLLGLLRRTGFTKHLEIETYTWEVLPDALKLDLTESIEREYRWVLSELAMREPLPVDRLAS